MNQIKPSSAILSQTINAANHAKVDQGKNIEKQILQNAVTKESPTEALEKKGAETEIDKYLTMVSRLDNQLKKGEISDEDLDKILTSLEQKILSLPKKLQEQLQNIKEFKEMKIEELKDIKEKMKKLLLEEKEREQVIQLLKNKEFFALMSEKPASPQTYSPRKA